MQYPNQPNGYNNTFNNRLISGYRNFQNNNVPFQQNKLLFNNPQFANAINYNQSQQLDNMRKMQYQQHMTRLKQLQKLKEIEKINNIDNLIAKDKLNEIIIRPIKIEKNNDSKELLRATNEKKRGMEGERQKYWKSRTNNPYKEILRKVNVLNDSDYRELTSDERKQKDKLMIHRVTDEDKIGLMEDLEKALAGLEKHENELKIIYSLDNRSEHKKKFEYNHKIKFRIAFDPTDAKDLKKDQMEYYKREQKKLEKNKKTIESIIESALLTGLLSEDEIKQIEYDEKPKKTNVDENISDYLSEIKDQISEDEYKKLLEQAKELELHVDKNDDDDTKSHISDDAKSDTSVDDDSKSNATDDNNDDSKSNATDDNDDDSKSNATDDNDDDSKSNASDDNENKKSLPSESSESSESEEEEKPIIVKKIILSKNNTKKTNESDDESSDDDGFAEYRNKQKK
jgi:hypothetical protein